MALRRLRRNVVVGFSVAVVNEILTLTAAFSPFARGRSPDRMVPFCANSLAKGLTAEKAVAPVPPGVAGAAAAWPRREQEKGNASSADHRRGRRHRPGAARNLAR